MDSMFMVEVIQRKLVGFQTITVSCFIRDDILAVSGMGQVGILECTGQLWEESPLNLVFQQGNFIENRNSISIRASIHISHPLAKI